MLGMNKDNQSIYILSKLCHIKFELRNSYKPNILLFSKRKYRTDNVVEHDSMDRTDNVVEHDSMDREQLVTTNW